MTTDDNECGARDVAEQYIEDLEADIEAHAELLGMTTEQMAHLWKHLTEQTLMRLIRLSPELVERVGERS